MYSLEHIKWIDSGFSLSTHVWQDKDDLIKPFRRARQNC